MRRVGFEPTHLREPVYSQSHLTNSATFSDTPNLTFRTTYRYIQHTQAPTTTTALSYLTNSTNMIKQLTSPSQCLMGLEPTLYWIEASCLYHSATSTPIQPAVPPPAQTPLRTRTQHATADHLPLPRIERLHRERHIHRHNDIRVTRNPKNRHRTTLK